MILKTIIIYILLIKSAYSQITVKKFDDYNHIAEAIKFVIKNYYYKKSSFINIIVESKSLLATHHLHEVLENVLKDISYLTIQIANADISEFIEMNIHTLVMVDSAESFENVCNQYSKSRSNFNNYFLVYLLRLQRGTYREITRIFKKVGELNVIDIDVLVEIQQNKIALYTYSPYTKYHCKETALWIIDYIVNGTMKKAANIFDIFPDKTGNLHQCPINVFALPDPPFLVVNNNKRTPYNYAGIAGRILSYLSIIANFSIVPVYDVEYNNITGFQTTELISISMVKCTLYMAPLYKQIFIGILLGLMSHGVLARPDYGPINWQRSEDFNSNEDVYSDLRKYPDNEPNFLSPWGIVSEDYEEAIHRMGLPARPPIVEVAELMPTPSPLRRVQQPPRNMLPIKERTEKKNSPYMSACHFKICNMGRKRNVRYLRF